MRPRSQPEAGTSPGLPSSPSSSAPSKFQHNLKLPSFDDLGIAAPHPDRIKYSPSQRLLGSSDSAGAGVGVGVGVGGGGGGGGGFDGSLHNGTASCTTLRRTKYGNEAKHAPKQRCINIEPTRDTAPSISLPRQTPPEEATSMDWVSSGSGSASIITWSSLSTPGTDPDLDPNTSHTRMSYQASNTFEGSVRGLSQQKSNLRDNEQNEEGDKEEMRPEVNLEQAIGIFGESKSILKSSVNANSFSPST
jgi:hypothetical protein